MFFNDNKSAITKAISVCEAAARGDFEARVTNITEKGDAARLLNAINRLIDRSDAYIRESRASLEYVAGNKYFRRISESGMTGSFLEASRTVNNAMGVMEGRVSAFTGVVQNFETQMMASVNSVTSAATELEASANTMEGATSSASEQATVVAAAAEQASVNVSSVASATEEMTNSVGEINQQVSHSAQITSEAVREVEQANKDIGNLSGAAEKVGRVVSLIADIADQTNLLALNATIEAARAGDAGKGFAVVATEVKGLANQTAKATEEIREQISEIQSASNLAVTSVETIGKTISLVDEATTTIAAAVEEQSAATAEIGRNIDQTAVGTSEVSSNIASISQAVGETGTAATVVLSASSELTQNGQSMRAEVESFLTEVRKVI